MIIQGQILINQFNNLSINQQSQMEALLKDVLIPFKGNINFAYPQGLKLYLQETKEI